MFFCSGHNSILSRNGASGNPWAVQPVVVTLDHLPDDFDFLGSLRRVGTTRGQLD
jgi:hypothetical protein